MEEEWKPIPNYPGYEASTHGQIRSYHKRGLGRWYIAATPQRILAAPFCGQYRKVGLRANKITHVRPLHQLIAETFIGPRPTGLVVCHTDDDPSNNHISNLRYDTLQNNIRDAQRNGTFPIKQPEPRRQKLSFAKAEEIRQAAANGQPHRSLAQQYGVHESTISKIVHNVRYPRPS